jgi:AcrR family transcriptional regulator
MTAKANLRSDSRRNHEAILTAAITVLASAPQASMSEIANASGTGRTTLYRHFPDRGALETAIYERALAESDSLTAATLREASADPIETVQNLCVALADLGDTYRCMGQHNAATVRSDVEERRHRGQPLYAFLRAAQQSGEISREASIDWLFSVLLALIMEASGPVFHDAEHRNEMLRTTVRRVLAP